MIKKGLVVKWIGINLGLVSIEMNSSQDRKLGLVVSRIGHSETGNNEE